MNEAMRRIEFLEKTQEKYGFSALRDEAMGDIYEFINPCFSPVTLPILWLFLLSSAKMLGADCGGSFHS